MKDLLSLYKECNLQVFTDTRKNVEGGLFFCLHGANFNGNKFAHIALENGAKYAVIDDSEYLSENTILVEDTLLALQQLANAYRKEFDIPVLGITGSNGKTTAKELISSVISKKYTCHSTPGNFNNHIGLPLTILSAPSNTEFLVLEMGDNHSGEIKLLSEIGEPNYGLVTNVGKDHIEGFGSFEANKMAKKELFDFIAQHHHSAFVPVFEEEVVQMSKDVKDRIFYGEVNSYSHVSPLESDPFVRYETSNGEKINTQLIGDYNIKNIETAVCIGRYFNVDEHHIHQAISEYKPQNNRSEFRKVNQHQVFLDAYNSNPSSLELALESFSRQNLSINKAVILGDMLELGEFSLAEHQSIVDLLSHMNYTTFLVGNEFSRVKAPDSFLFFKDVQELIEHLRSKPLAPSQILIKGSRGIRLEKALEAL